MRTIARPKGWVKADAVRVVRNGGKLMVEIRRRKSGKRTRPGNGNQPAKRELRPVGQLNASPPRNEKRRENVKPWHSLFFTIIR